jgi:hypothetical protein
LSCKKWNNKWMNELIISYWQSKWTRQGKLQRWWYEKVCININVFVETKDGKSFPSTIKSTTSIAELKDIILSTEDIPPADTRRLILAIHLGDDKNLENQSAWIFYNNVKKAQYIKS